MRQFQRPLTSRRMILVIPFLATLLLAPSAWGVQQDSNNQRGFAAGQSYQLGQIENVNLFNGNLVLRLPIGGSYPGGGDFSYALTLTYNSKLWDIEVECDQLGQNCEILPRPNLDSNAGFGFQLTLGHMLPPMTPPRNDADHWLYVSSDRAEHRFWVTLHEGDDQVSGLSYTRDGSYLRMVDLAGGERRIDHPDGSRHFFDAAGRLKRIEDLHGNGLSVGTTATTWTLSDDFEREHKVFFKRWWMDGQQVYLVDRVKLATFGGTSSQYHFAYETKSVRRAAPFRDLGGQTLPDPTQITFLTKVTLPDGSSYAFPEYLLDHTQGNRSPGLPTELTVPTLGKIQLLWRRYEFPTFEELGPNDLADELSDTIGLFEWKQATPGGAGLGRWRYKQELLVPSDPHEKPVQSKTVVTSPLNHKTHHYFSAYPGGREDPNPHRADPHLYGSPFTPLLTDGTGTKRYLSTQVYKGSSNLQRSTYVRYTRDEARGLSHEQNRRLWTRRTVYHDDGNKHATETFSDWDGLGHYRTRATSGNFDYGNARTTITGYNPGVGTYHVDPASGDPLPGHDFTMPGRAHSWALGTYDGVRSSDGGGTVQEDFCFDNDTGSLLRTRRRADWSTRGSSDVVRVLSRNSQGEVTREALYGGDRQSVGRGQDLCALALPASPVYDLRHAYANGPLLRSRYYDPATGIGLKHAELDLEIDFHTGLASASRDASGLRTEYEYDGQGRLTWSKPESGHGGWTQYVYTTATSMSQPARVNVYRRANGSKDAVVLAESELRFDLFGRLAQEREKRPDGGWVTRETFYNALGLETSVSELEAGSTRHHTTQYLDYDPFGRPGKIRPPAGQHHDVRLFYNGARRVVRQVKVATSRNGEAYASTEELYDRQGRLYKVTDPTGLVAEYRYDAGQRLNRVILRGGNNQNRYFTYDGRGFLTSESQPESGTVTYEDIDARGKPWKRLHGGRDLRMAYDAAARLVNVREGGTNGRVLETYTYATENSAGNRKKGRLEEAVRHNHVEIPWAPGFVYDWQVKERFTYGGRDGRVSYKETHIGQADRFVQSWLYDPLGNVTSQTFPRCLTAPCASAGTPGQVRTVTRRYTQGQLTSIPGYAGSIAYHPSGLVARVDHTNGVS